MTSYDDYVSSLTTLGQAIADADHASAQAQRSTNAAVEKFDLDTKQRTQRVQKQAVDLVTEYASAARLLQGRNAEGIGLQLPDRVRPMANSAGTNDAAAKQRQASKALSRLIERYATAVAKEAGAADDAAAALAARRASLAKPQAELAPAPVESAPDPVSLPQKRSIGPLGEAPLVGLVFAVPLGGLGALFGGTVGLIAGLAAALVVAFVLVCVLGFSLRGLKDKSASRMELPSLQRSKASSGVLDRASEKGTMTGFEPEALKAVEIPKHPLMYGKPGVGLSDSGFDKGAVKAGQTGEVNFAKALTKAELLQRFATFWSIHMLSKDTYGREQSDVDCAIVTGHTIWLVDVKYYPGGNVVYRSKDGQQLVCYDVPTGEQIGQPKKMSKNMQMAIERFRNRYKNYGSFDLQARVVFVPTNRGVGQIDGVRWPGDIPAVMLPEFLADLQAEPPFVESLDSDLVRRTFQGLLKS